MEKKLRHWLEWWPWWFIIGLAAGFAAFAIGMEILAGIFFRHRLGLLVSYPASAAFLFYALLSILAACRVKVGVAGEMGLALGFFGGMVICHPLLLWLAATLLGAGSWVLSPAQWLARLPGLWMAGNACVILAAAFLGRLVGRIIREASLLPVVAVVASGIDLWGVYWGPVGQLSATEEGRVIGQQFSAAVPGVAAAAKAGLPVLTGIGLGDFVFLAIFFSALRRLRLNQRGAFWVTFAILMVAPAFFLLGEILPVAENLPGLPFIAAGIVASNHRHLKMSRRELRISAAAAAIIIVVIAAIWAVKRFLK